MQDAVTARAPGRVNLIGEHLDYNGGLCLPIAIDRRTTAVVRQASGVGHVLTSDVAPDGWTAYVLGVLAALGVTDPLEVTVTSEVPLGAGLASSAALTCSVAVAVNELLGLGRSPDQLVATAIRAENDHVGVPTGGMDQAAALFGSPGRALLLDFDAGTRAPVAWRPEDDGCVLVVIDTRVQHALADSAYADRRADCEAAAARLGLTFLARADESRLTELSGTERMRARHVVSEQRRVRELVAAATSRDWTRAGSLMTGSHASLRDDFEVSCPELDLAVDASLAAGALGARMTGGGFGGAAIALVRAADLGALRREVEAGFARNDWEAPTVFVVEASRGAELLAAT